MSRQQVQHHNPSLPLGSLGSQQVISVLMDIDESRENGVMIKQFKASVDIRDKTVNEGPIRVGFSVGLSDAEIKEALDADPQGANDVPATEQANRKVFPVWTIPSGLVSSNEIQVLADIHFPWKEIDEGTAVTIWAQNCDSSTLTTGAVITTLISLVQEWLND